MIGVASVVFHWSNGLWTAAISWGITITPAAQKRWGYVCMTLGIVLTVFGGGAILGALQHQITPAEKLAIEQAIDAYKTQGLIVHEASPHPHAQPAPTQESH